MRLPWEPTTFIFKSYNPYLKGLKPSFFMGLGSKGGNSIYLHLVSKEKTPTYPGSTYTQSPLPLAYDSEILTYLYVGGTWGMLTRGLLEFS